MHNHALIFVGSLVACLLYITLACLFDGRPVKSPEEARESDREIPYGIIAAILIGILATVGAILLLAGSSLERIRSCEHLMLLVLALLIIAKVVDRPSKPAKRPDEAV